MFIQEFQKLARSRAKGFKGFPGELLTTNGKLGKGAVASKGLQLLPSVYSGAVNTCPHSDTCIFSCIGGSGKGNMIHQKKILTPSLELALYRTLLLVRDRDQFLRRLRLELELFSSSLGGKIGLVRLNVFSDLDWRDFIAGCSNLENILFYDYTRDWDREPMANYHVTYSYGVRKTPEDVVKAVSRGRNVAVVCSAPKKRQSLESGTFFFPGFDVGFFPVDGDIDDNRPMDPCGSVVLLKGKNSIFGAWKGKGAVEA